MCHKSRAPRVQPICDQGSGGNSEATGPHMTYGYKLRGVLGLSASSASQNEYETLKYVKLKNGGGGTKDEKRVISVQGNKRSWEGGAKLFFLSSRLTH